MDELYDVVSVKAIDGYQLDLEFEDGLSCSFDMRPLLDKKPFTKLRDKAVFREARVAYGTVTWPGGVDIAPETLRDGGRKAESRNEGLFGKVEMKTAYNDGDFTTKV